MDIVRFLAIGCEKHHYDIRLLYLGLRLLSVVFPGLWSSSKRYIECPIASITSLSGAIQEVSLQLWLQKILTNLFTPYILT